MLSALWRAAGFRRCGVEPNPFHRRRAGAALVVRGRHRRPSDDRRDRARCRRTVAPAHWPPAERLASTCAARELSFAASATCASTANGRRIITMQSPDFIAAATAAGRGCIPICRIIAAVSSSCSAAPTTKKAVQRALNGWTGRGAGDRGRRCRPCGDRVPVVRRMGPHPQGRAVAQLPLFSIEKIGDAPPKPLRSADRPLSGVKVLDLTRIIAGPVCGRTLAAHGAEVLLITAPHLASMLPLVIDTGRGKLSASVDLRGAGGRETLAALLRDADIFVQGYRPGAIAACGFGPEEAARLWPGIVYASLSAYGHDGPWALRRGFDSLVQTASGFNIAEREAFASPNRGRCRRRCSITPPDICSPSGLWRRWRAGSWRAAPGTCAFRSPKPAIGCGSSAASMAWRVPIPASMMCRLPGGEAPPGSAH